MNQSARAQVNPDCPNLALALVWQRCQDWYGDYPQKDVVDPQGPEKGKERVLRGGSWDFVPEHCRSACRNWIDPGSRYFGIGCRLCFYQD
jgi:sulfatase modifying factor 1